jgi:TRAP-type C4-dicarboxylate transport system permease large subunit
MIAPKDYILKNRAALFDWMVLSVSFMLGFIFPTISDFFISPGYYNWMLAALLFYTVGAALKHLPLSYRITYSAKAVKPVPYLIFLVIGHWFIILLLVIFAEPAIRHILHLEPLKKNNSTSGELLIAATLIAAFVTWLVYRSKNSRKKRKIYSVNYLTGMELTADILLIAGVSIFSFVFWEKGALAMLGRVSTQTISDIWFLFIFLAILFLFFYLPFRYLFFIEDRENGRNSRRLFLIFGFMLLRALFDMLNI